MAPNETTHPPDPEAFTDDSPNPPADAELAVLCDALQERDVTRVVVRYQGSGDSGGAHEVEVEPPDARLPRWVEDRLRDVAEGYCPDGYENDEGGYGSLTVYPALGLAALEHFDCYEDSEEIEIDPPPLPEGLRQRLAALGVRRLTVSFDGYGDSGEFDPPEVDPAGVTLEPGLEEELEGFLFEQLPGGWEINEGGFGHFTVEVASGEVMADAYDRTEQESEAQATRWKWRE